MSSLQPVHVRVNDAATGKPTPCRVRFTDAEGKYYAPYGRLTEFAVEPGMDVGGNVRPPLLDNRGKILIHPPNSFAYIDGSCEIGLPPGAVYVTILKGPEYVPIQERVDLAAGKLALRFIIERWSNVRSSGWHPGDVRAHCMSPQAAWLDGRGEDLAVVNVLAMMTSVVDPNDSYGLTRFHAAIPNVLEFSGQKAALEGDGCMVVVNTHNRHPRLGSLGLLNSHRIVYPLCFGQPPFGDPYENWTLADWCDQCHRKHGLTVWTNTNMALLNACYGEALADLILGKVDAVEVDHFASSAGEIPWEFDWYGLLNCGLRVPLVGGSGKDSNVIPLGNVRTYARLIADQPLTYQNWIEAVRAGRTFATNGPLLSLTVDGCNPGETIQVADDRSIEVRAAAQCLTPFERLEVIANGAVVASHGGSGNQPVTAAIETTIHLPEGGWVAARCFGKAWVSGYFSGQRIYAHTSPVYVRVPGSRPPVDQDAVRRFISHLKSTLNWVDTQGRFENDGQRLRLRKVFEDAMQILQKRLG